MQSALLHQIITESAELKSSIVVVEVRARDHAEPGIGKTRSIAVAMLETDVDHPANDER